MCLISQCGPIRQCGVQARESVLNRRKDAANTTPILVLIGRAPAVCFAFKPGDKSDRQVTSDKGDK